MAKDVIVVVQRDALPSEKESLDILLVSTTGVYPVATYRDTDSVKAVYGPDGPCPNAKIVRKATTLLNQGKTTLAEGLVNKFKIVSFAPPSATPAKTAVLTATFADETLEKTVAADTTLYVRFGGDDNAVVEITTEADVTTGAALAALFDGTSFTKGSKTYTATVDGSVVTYTATESGEADTIPELAAVFADEELLQEAEVAAPDVEFTNGADTISAPDNLINAIEQFQKDEDDDWYFMLTDHDEDEYVLALAAFAAASEPTEAELESGVEDHRKFYMGQTSNKALAKSIARAAVIYTDNLNEEADASYTGNVAPFYPYNVTWKFKRPQNGNADTSEGTKLITLPKLTEGERDTLTENHVNYLTEEYKRQYVKEGVCLDGEYIDVVLGGDWIAKRMRDLLYDILLDNASIEYSDAGFGLISTAVLQALAEAADDDHNIIAVDQESKSGIYTVNVPTYDDSTEEQRRNRIMPNITWEAQIAGSIHKVKTKGVLSVSL